MTRTAADAYTAVAPRYDALEQRKGLLSRARAQSLSALKQHLPRRGRLLELGCGTGTEAIEISRELDATVVAFDPSRGMVNEAAGKAKNAGATVDFRQGTASEALRVLAEEDTAFDGAWASFSLAYDVPLEDLRVPLAAVLKPGAPFVCSLPNPWVVAAPWRIPTRILGRSRNRVDGALVPMRATSPRSAAKALSPDFSLAESKALSVLVPPARFQRVWNLLGSAARPWERLDERVSSKPVFRSLGDHSLLVFRRGPIQPPAARPSAE